MEISNLRSLNKKLSNTTEKIDKLNEKLQRIQELQESLEEVSMEIQKLDYETDPEVVIEHHVVERGSVMIWPEIRKRPSRREDVEWDETLDIPQWAADEGEEVSAQIDNSRDDLEDYIGEVIALSAHQPENDPVVHER